MKRVIGLVFVFGAASFFAGPSAHAATTAPAPKPTAKAKGPMKLTMADYAPADEYFGPMKLSILGIRNTIRDLGFKVDADPSKGDQQIGSASFAEKALHDWQKKYPRDPQLPRNIYFLEHFYAKVPTPLGAQKVAATDAWLFSSYGNTPQARQLRKEIAEAKNATPSPAPTSSPYNVPTGSPIDQQQNAPANIVTPSPVPLVHGK